ncbi:anaphase-promoting complex subunit 8 [Pancytospora philotis]|nr:anaphase-promoting complex subunit 8 [Pancytospora philotis]
MEQFAERNLSRTVDFLCRTGHGCAVTLSLEEPALRAIACMNSGDCLSAYHALLCAEAAAHIGTVVLCSCCGSVANFLRNHSLLLHQREPAAGPRPGKLFADEFAAVAHSAAAQGAASHRHSKMGRVIVYEGFRGDAFCDYIVAMANRDVHKLIDAINMLPLFWDAFLLLAELTDAFVEIDSPIAPYFYMLLKVTRDIDPPGCTPDYTQSHCAPLDILSYQLPADDLGLLGAFLYVSGEPELAHTAFSRLFFGSSAASAESHRKSASAPKHDARRAKLLELIASATPPAHPSSDYADIAAYVFFVYADARLPILVEVLKTLHPNKAETLAATGVFHGSAASHEVAKSCFRKSLRIKHSLDVLSMLGHTLVNLKDRGGALETFAAVLREAGTNARLLYSVAQGFFMLEMDEHAAFYAHKSLGIRSDGAVWKLVGRVHIRCKEYDQALHALRQAERFGEKDALLYMAEVSKRMDRSELVPGFYEAYIKVGEKNKSAVLKFLVDHFKEAGDVEKSNYYRAMLL